MSEQEIENRDQEVVNKFRAMVYAKARGKKKKNLYVGAVSGIRLLAGISLLALYLSVSGSLPTKSVKHHSARIALDAERRQNASLPSDTRPQTKNSSESKSNARETTGKTDSPESSDNFAASNLDQAEALNQPANSAAPETETTNKSAQPEKKVPEGIRIAEIITCRTVENKQYVSPETEFSIHRDNRPEVWVWMDVRSKKRRLPYLLRHAYYLNGQKYAAVVLEIKYQRMRTWSNITLDHEKYAGDWRVEVLTADKQTIAETQFQVVP